MIEKLLKIYFDMDEDVEMPVEFMGEDDNGNGIWKIK